ncbi:MAG: hypothetical protein SPJ92_06830 [Bariatricus sp.]|nr:hypothetical protein [Bariatricus sp.]
MKKLRKLGAIMICLAVMVGLMPTITARAEETSAGIPMLSVQAADNTILSYKYSETKKLKLTVQNTGGVNLKNIRITPRVSEKIEEWPFEIENKDYTYVIDHMEPGEKLTVEFEFTARENVSLTYYKLPFDFTAEADDESGRKIDGEYGIYVKTIAKEEEKPQDNQSGQTTQEPSGNAGSSADDIPAGYGDAGGITNIDSGSSGSGIVSTPRVIVTGFSTNPAEVKAGSNFRLTIHLKNTSRKTAVSNMLFDLSSPTEGSDETASPAFLPSSGSSSIYLEKIKANGTQDISIELNAKSDLVQKPYSVEISMKYEDSEGGQYESMSSVSIPVKQDARFEFSEFEINPEMISVGEEANIMCELYNLGRVKLYNVKARFEGNGIKTEELFVGNVESGATASIDGMLLAEEATAGPETMKMILSYEDESGNVTEFEKEFQLEIMEAVMDDMFMDENMMEEPKASFPIIPIIIVLLIIAAMVVGIIIMKKKKKRRLEEEEEGLVDEYHRLTEDEHRES